MMGMLLVASLFSAALLVLLCIGDPKRRRSARMPGKAHGTTARRLLVIASLLPGTGYALGGDAANFLLWLGAYAVVGWLVALSFSALREG